MTAINSKASIVGQLLCRPYLLLFLSNVLLIWIVVGFGFSQWHDENAVLENLQAALLLCGSILGLPVRNAGRSVNDLRVLFSVVCLSFLLRELDLEKLDLPMIIQILGSGTGRVISLAVLWSYVLYRFYTSGLEPGAALRVSIRSPQFRVLCVVLVLLLISLVFDKQFIPVAHTRLFEELAETNAYLLLVIFTLPAQTAGRVASRSNTA